MKFSKFLENFKIENKNLNLENSGKWENFDSLLKISKSSKKSQNFDYLKSLIISKVWLSQKFDYLKSLIIPKVWLSQHLV